MIHNPRGSEWHRWDLHIHTPETKLSNSYKCKESEGVWDKYIDILENSNVDVFGITDYFSCDNYFSFVEKHKQKHPESKKVFFPNIEFRLSDAISEDNKNPDFHVLFDNDLNRCSQKKLNKFLQALNTYAEDNSGVSVCCSDLSSTKEYESASVTLKAISEALQATFGNDMPYLLAFPAKNDGVRSTDMGSPRKILITDTIDKKTDFFFGDADSKKHFLRDDRYDSGKSKPKPVVSGSDTHSFDDLKRLEGNEANFPPTWIKADLTFRGLQQICFEPEHRVYIGQEVPVEQRKNSQATKFITHLNIRQVTGYDESNGQWFNNVELPINPELTAIIGNKGSGKSALIDIIGLLGESKKEEFFSFLTNNSNNKKFKKPGYAENFEAKLTWLKGDSNWRSLNDSVDKNKPERVRYLPQNYFEKLTNELEIEDFRNEIEDVVFSHIDDTDRLGQASFEDLEDYKTQQSKQDTSNLKSQLRELNLEIVKLEEKSDPLTLNQLDNELLTKKNELKALEEPKKIDKPSEEDGEQQQLTKEIEVYTEQLNSLEKAGLEKKEKISFIKGTFQKFDTLYQSLNQLDEYISKRKLELKENSEELGFDIEKLISAEIKKDDLLKEQSNCKVNIATLEKDNELDFDKLDFTNKADLKSLSYPDLRGGYSFIQAKINSLKEKLSAPQRKHQLYLEKLKKYNDDIIKIEGSKDNPQPNTIYYLNNTISYIKTDLAQELEDKQKERKTYTRNIFNSKSQILEFYSNLKKSVENKLDSVRSTDFSVDIKASFVLDNSFEEAFLKFINQTCKGPFQGLTEGGIELRNHLSLVDWNDIESIFNFTDIVLEKMKSVQNGKEFNKQVSEIKNFYDFLFSLEYISPKYELRLGDKNLNELSPGEKGMLLLVFYLQLDKDNIPLIIDQPEDNLDNDSVFAVLANCIRKAKENRQIILVTHNPNLAVGADAEQIIYVNLNKADNYKFDHESGAIENPKINEKIVEVLEGSQPAFVKRRLIYQI